MEVSWEQGSRQGMGKAEEVISQVYEGNELWEKYGLSYARKREFSEFNLVIGKNGSGKSRFLKMLKEFAENRRDDNEAPVKVILLDCSVEGDFPKSGELDERISTTLLRNVELPDVRYLNLLDFVKDTMGELLEMLEALTQAATRKWAEDTLKEVNQEIQDILGRKIEIVDNKCVLTDEKTRIDVLPDQLERLSPGERNILYIVLAVLCMKREDSSCIFLIDEPETHLHPAALVKLYALMEKMLKKVDHCTFIASHSMFILPRLAFSQIIFVENGILERINSDLYYNIYENLMETGDDGHDLSLSSFLQSISEWQYAGFLAECFLEPSDGTKANAEDVQYLKLKKSLLQLFEQDQVVEILDYGAGSGRIAKCMEMDMECMGDGAEKDVLERLLQIKYHIYDKYKITEEFKQNSGWHGSAFASEEKLNERRCGFHLILLFNVLHEVGINKWAETLNFIMSLLKPGGYLLFSERKVLSSGERPYGESGYLVLDEEEIKRIFPGCEVEKITYPDNRHDPTLALTICKSVEKVVDVNNVRSALQHLKERSEKRIYEFQSREKIDDMAEKARKHFPAREYAFYCQQYFNVVYALKLLGQQNDPKKVMSYADICNDVKSFEEKKKFMEERAQYDDEDGEKCKEWLRKMNHQ